MKEPRSAEKVQEPERKKSEQIPEQVPAPVAVPEETSQEEPNGDDIKGAEETENEKKRRPYDNTRGERRGRGRGGRREFDNNRRNEG